MTNVWDRITEGENIYRVLDAMLAMRPGDETAFAIYKVTGSDRVKTVRDYMTKHEFPYPDHFFPSQLVDRTLEFSCVRPIKLVAISA